MDKKLANYFFEETSNALAFLVNEHSFAPPQLEIDYKINFVFVTFMGKYHAIECSLDEREGDIACIVAKVTNGKRATYMDAPDENDEHGVRVRVSLRLLLEQRGVREKLLTPSGSLVLFDRIRIRLADFAQMLRMHGQEILSGSPYVL